MVIYEVGERIDVARSSSTLPSYPPAILYFHCRNFAKQRNGIWELARECIVENSFYSDIVTNLRGQSIRWSLKSAGDVVVLPKPPGVYVELDTGAIDLGDFPSIEGVFFPSSGFREFGLSFRILSNRVKYCSAVY